MYQLEPRPAISTRARNVVQRDSAKTAPNTLLRSRCKVKWTRMGLLWCDRQSGAAARSVGAHPRGARWLVAPRRSGGRRSGLAEAGRLAHGLRQLLQSLPRRLRHEARRFFAVVGAGGRCRRIAFLQLRQALLLLDLGRVRREPRYGRDVHVAVRDRHEGVPGLGRQQAAGDVVHRAEVVVAHPDAGDELAGVADEPGVAIARARAGLAGDVREIERRALAGAVGDDELQHLVHLLGDARGDDLRRRRLVAFAGVDELALRVEELEDAVGPRELAAVGEGSVGAGVLEHRHATVAERHRTGLLDAGHTEPVGHLDDLVAADLEREIDGYRVERLRQRVGHRHRAAAATTAGVVARRPVPARGGDVAHRRLRRVAIFERGRVDVGLERGSGLALGLGGAVELTLAVVEAADDGAHRAVGVHGDERPRAGPVRAALLAHRRNERLVGRFLHGEIDRGAGGQDEL